MNKVSIEEAEGLTVEEYADRVRVYPTKSLKARWFWSGWQRKMDKAKTLSQMLKPMGRLNKLSRR